MQRSNKPRWRKTGGGVMVLSNGRDVHSGQVFRASEHEIPGGAFDLVERIDPEPSPESEEPPKNNLKVVHKGGGWYDVVNTETDQPINSTSMRQDEAKQLAQMELEEAEEQVQEKEAAEADEGEQDNHSPEDEGDE